MLQKSHIIQQTGMLVKLSSGHLFMLKTGIPSILQRPPLVNPVRKDGALIPPFL
jgi:hypothetical protein